MQGEQPGRERPPSCPSHRAHLPVCGATHLREYGEFGAVRHRRLGACGGQGDPLPAAVGEPTGLPSPSTTRFSATLREKQQQPAPMRRGPPPRPEASQASMGDTTQVPSSEALTIEDIEDEDVADSVAFVCLREHERRPPPHQAKGAASGPPKATTSQAASSPTRRRRHKLHQAKPEGLESWDTEEMPGTDTEEEACGLTRRRRRNADTAVDTPTPRATARPRTPPTAREALETVSSESHKGVVVLNDTTRRRYACFIRSQPVMILQRESVFRGHEEHVVTSGDQTGTCKTQPPATQPPTPRRLQGPQ